VSLMGLVKYYVLKDITSAELAAIFNYMMACHDESMVRTLSNILVLCVILWYFVFYYGTCYFAEYFGTLYSNAVIVTLCCILVLCVVFLVLCIVFGTLSSIFGTLYSIWYFFGTLYCNLVLAYFCEIIYFHGLEMSWFEHDGLVYGHFKILILFILLSPACQKYL